MKWFKIATCWPKRHLCKMFVQKKNIQLHWHTLGTFPHWDLYLFCITPCTGFHMTNTIFTVRSGGGSKHHAVGVFLSGRTLSAVQAEWRMKEAKCKVWQAWMWIWHKFRFIDSCRPQSQNFCIYCSKGNIHRKVKDTKWNAWGWLRGRWLIENNLKRNAQEK